MTRISNFFKTAVIFSLSLFTITGCVSDSYYSKIKERGKIIIGVPKDYAPFSYRKEEKDKKGEKGELTGYDIECAKLVGKKLKMKILFKEMDNDKIVPALDAGKIDATVNQQYVNFKIDPDKDEKPDYYFSYPYKYSRLTCVVRKNNTELKHFDDQRDLKIAMTQGDFFEDSVLNDGGIILKQKNTDDCFKAVETGKADGTMNDLLAFQYYMKKHPDANLKSSVLSANLYGLNYMTKSEELSLKLTSAIKKIRNDGSLSDLSKRLFHQDISVKS